MYSVLSKLGLFAKGFAGAVLGVIVVLLLLHAWNDHAALHDLATYINTVAPKINKLP